MFGDNRRVSCHRKRVTSCLRSDVNGFLLRFVLICCFVFIWSLYNYVAPFEEHVFTRTVVQTTVNVPSPHIIGFRSSVLSQKKMTTTQLGGQSQGHSGRRRQKDRQRQIRMAALFFKLTNYN